MCKYLNLIPKNQNIIQIGINDVSLMTLFIKVNKDGFGCISSIYFDNLFINKI